ncbi:MAG: RNase adapter RapZ [Candidatus Sericytochromatia bacterium]|nr:RNase adapter RapZ [Candidatus Sericytochromatia bacterium]
MVSNAKPLLIVSGLSGAGKSQALRCLEDVGYFCVDNLLPALIAPFADLIRGQFTRVALVVDSRGGSFLHDLSGSLHALRERGIPYRILFLEASNPILVQRFSETRRRHPLMASTDAPLLESIAVERQILAEMRALADVLVDTTALTSTELKNQIVSSLVDPEAVDARLQISVISFGFRFGLPLDADLVFDVRFLPNPHYDPLLKPHTGMDAPVRDYVLGQEVTKAFLTQLEGFLRHLLPHYRAEGKTSLTIAVGCTGGRHRSVAIAHELVTRLETDQAGVIERHRDMFREPARYAEPSV